MRLSRCLSRRRTWSKSAISSQVSPLIHSLVCQQRRSKCATREVLLCPSIRSEQSCGCIWDQNSLKVGAIYPRQISDKAICLHLTSVTLHSRTFSQLWSSQCSFCTLLSIWVFQHQWFYFQQHVFRLPLRKECLRWFSEQSGSFPPKSTLSIASPLRTELRSLKLWTPPRLSDWLASHVLLNKVLSPGYSLMLWWIVDRRLFQTHFVL